MTKKIIGSIGLVVGLAVATFFLLHFLFQDKDAQRPTPDLKEKPQVAASPTPAKPQEPASPASEPAAPPEPVTPQPSAPAPPTAEPAPAEHIPEPQPPLEPKEEHGLLAGKYRNYERAKKRMEKIKKQDIPAFIRQGGKYYEVWAGPFNDPQEAEQARKTLKKALKISPKKRKLEIPVPK
jgi:cell division septation protein DedD